MIRVSTLCSLAPLGRLAVYSAAFALLLAVPHAAHAERTLPDIFVRPIEVRPGEAPKAVMAPHGNVDLTGAVPAMPSRYKAPQPQPLLAAEPTTSSTSTSAQPSSGTDPVGAATTSSSNSSNTSPVTTTTTISPAESVASKSGSGSGSSNTTTTYVSPPTATTPATISTSTGGSSAESTVLPTSSLPTSSFNSGTDKPVAQGAPANASAPPSAYEMPPLASSSIQNAVQTEAERIYYQQRRKQQADTFERAYEGLVPLGPNEVRETMGRYERTQRAAVPPSTGQPRGQVRIGTLSLEPGSDPPTVNVAAGYVTTITIVDATGQPWPILDVGIGGNFEVTKTGGGQASTHVVRIMPLTRFGFGNLSIVLQDMPTPIIFKLASGGTTVDYRFDGRVPRMGPNAKMSLIDRKGYLQAGSALIMSFLDNAPPPDAKRVKVMGADARTLAWMLNDKMYVRTPLTMLSPSWDSSVSSADGTTVYELRDTPSLLMSDNGALIRARITQREEE